MLQVIPVLAAPIPLCMVNGSAQNGGAYLLGTPNYESNYIQMFLLGLHDAQFFEPVISGPQGRIYRVKR